MSSIDMCEHDWPGSGCPECFPKPTSGGVGFRFDVCMTPGDPACDDSAPPQLAELQATIAEEKKWRESAEGGWRKANKVIAMQREKLDALESEIERLKGGQGEPVAYFFREIGEGDWHPCNKEQYERFSKYPEMDTKTSQPAPVSVVLPGRMTREQALELTDYPPESAMYWYNKALDDARLPRQGQGAESMITKCILFCLIFVWAPAMYWLAS